MTKTKADPMTETEKLKIVAESCGYHVVPSKQPSGFWLVWDKKGAFRKFLGRIGGSEWTGNYKLFDPLTNFNQAVECLKQAARVDSGGTWEAKDGCGVVYVLITRPDGDGWQEFDAEAPTFGEAVVAAILASVEANDDE